MAKLSEEALEEGRKLIIAGDENGFAKWIETHNIMIGVKAFEMCVRAGDVARALRLFNKTFPNIDPEEDARKAQEAEEQFAQVIAAIAEAVIGPRIAQLEEQVKRLQARVHELDGKGQ